MSVGAVRLSLPSPVSLFAHPRISGHWTPPLKQFVLSIRMHDEYSVPPPGGNAFMQRLYLSLFGMMCSADTATARFSIY